MLTLQQIFDEVCSHVIAQGEPAIHHGTCQYLTDQGTSCAIGGPLVKRGLYKPQMEETRYYHLNAQGGYVLDTGLLPDALREWGITDGDATKLVSMLQSNHDKASDQVRHSEFLHEFRMLATVTAQEFNLSTAVLQ